MAAIGSIRKRSGLLIIIIGVALVLFLLSDFLGKSTFGGPSGETNVGYVKGEPVSQQEFAVRVENAVQQQGQAVSTDQRSTVRSRVWEQILRERILETEYTNLGIHVSTEELIDQIRNAKPGSLIYQYFSDPNTGQVLDQFRNPNNGLLDGNKVLQTVNNILAGENAGQWYPIEAAIKEDAKMQKYMTLLKSGMTATSTEAQKTFEERSATVSFNYVVKEFSSIPDAEVELNDAELKAYYNKHKNEKRFEQKNEQRDIKYVVFDMAPTPDDIATLKIEMAEMMPSFEKDTNDTFFVLENSDRRLNENLEYKIAQTLNPAIMEQVISAEVGAVFGPYQEGEYMNITKLSGLKASPDSAKASHIFIQADPNDPEAMANAKVLADSLKSVIEKKNNFGKIAEEYSDDLGTATNGGEIANWLTVANQEMPLAVVRKALDGENGDLEVVQSEAGVHILKINEQTEAIDRYLMATVDNRIEPSKATANAAYKAASEFAISHKTKESFENTDEKNVVLVAQNVVPGSKTLGRVTDADEIIRWAFNAEPGDVSDPKETETSIIVAMLDIVKTKGALPFEAAKPLITSEARNEKKAEKIITDLGAETTLQDAATKFGTSTQTAANASFESNSLPGGLGRELKVLGAAVAMEPNQVSAPIKGNRGVFVIQVTSKTAASGEADIANEKRQLTSTLASKVTQSAYQALKDVSNIEDNRALFY